MSPRIAVILVAAMRSEYVRACRDGDSAADFPGRRDLWWKRVADDNVSVARDNFSTGKHPAIDRSRGILISGDDSFPRELSTRRSLLSTRTPFPPRDSALLLSRRITPTRPD